MKVVNERRKGEIWQLPSGWELSARPLTWREWRQCQRLSTTCPTLSLLVRTRPISPVIHSTLTEIEQVEPVDWWQQPEMKPISWNSTPPWWWPTFATCNKHFSHSNAIWMTFTLSFSLPSHSVLIFLVDYWNVNWEFYFELGFFFFVLFSVVL